MNLATIILLLDTAVQRYGQFEVAEDDWRKSHDRASDRGHHHFSYALYPHGGDWKQALTVRHGYEYNYQLRAMQVAAHAGSLPTEHSFASVQPENIVLTAMKKAEDSESLILHAYEWAGKSGDVTFTVPEGSTGATLTSTGANCAPVRLVHAIRNRIGNPTRAGCPATWPAR